MLEPTEIKLSGPEVITLFSCSTQLSIKFIMLVNCWHFHIYKYEKYNICEVESKKGQHF